MAFTQRQQKMIVEWIFKICLLVVLSNPSGVVGLGFPGGLRGPLNTDVADVEVNKEVSAEVDSVSDSISLDEDPESESDWEKIEKGEEEDKIYNQYIVENSQDGEKAQDDSEDSLETQEERELHVTNNYRRRWNNGRWNNNNNNRKYNINNNRKKTNYQQPVYSNTYYSSNYRISPNSYYNAYPSSNYLYTDDDEFFKGQYKANTFWI